MNEVFKKVIKHFSETENETEEEVLDNMLLIASADRNIFPDLPYEIQAKLVEIQEEKISIAAQLDKLDAEQKYGKGLDTGFRVFKIAEEKELVTDEDKMFDAALKLGYLLDKKYKKEDGVLLYGVFSRGKTEANLLVCCFDKDLTEEKLISILHKYTALSYAFSKELNAELKNLIIQSLKPIPVMFN